MRTTAKARSRNIGLKRNIKEATKAFHTKPTAEALSKAQSTLDIAVKKNLLKKGTASRRKARLAKVARDAGVKLGAKSAKKPVAAKKAAAVKKVVAKKPVAKKTSVKKAAAKPVNKKAVVTKKK